MSSADAGPAGRMRRLVLGAGLAIGDQVGAVIDEAAQRAEAEAAQLEDRQAGAATLAPVPAAGAERRADDTVVAFVVPSFELAPNVRHVVIGAVSEAGDRAADLVLGATHLVGATVDRLAPLTVWAWRAPMLDPLRSRADDAVRRLADRGRLEEAVARRQAHETFGLAVGAVSASVVIDQVIAEVLGRNLQPILEGALPTALRELQNRPELLVPLVESIVGQVLQPILDTAIPSVMGDLQARPELIVPLVESIVGKALQPILDQALPLVMDDIARQPELLMPLVMGIVDEALEPLLQAALPRVIEVLNEDPDAIRSLVRDQSTGIAVEMTETVRFKAADADERIDRIVRRVLRRKPVAAAPVAVAPVVARRPELNPGAGAHLEALPSSGVAVDAPSGAATARRDGHPSVEPGSGANR